MELLCKQAGLLGTGHRRLVLQSWLNCRGKQANPFPFLTPAPQALGLEHRQTVQGSVTESAWESGDRHLRGPAGHPLLSRT